MTPIYMSKYLNQIDNYYKVPLGIHLKLRFSQRYLNIPTVQNGKPQINRLYPFNSYLRTILTTPGYPG